MSDHIRQIFNNINCVEVDFKNASHTDALLTLLQVYATDPMGGGEPIESKVTATLITEMSKRSHVFSVIVFADKVLDSSPSVSTLPIAFANCIESFSTFKGRAVVNIHDFAVIPEARGHGISQRLLQCIEEVSIARGACKLTLEVLEGNTIAKNAYLKAGFSGYELDPALGQALFWEKSL
ncbi:GNAT family N-acetyltransferase [Glaciecola sp. SC05]|uniref:GNAT family N-acetyltransferase n=1 Tax=Glaciecola sp. SC05 TaxID=1987355 RepID=UPI0035271C61